MPRINERETTFLVTSKSDRNFRWKACSQLKPGLETILAKAYFDGVPSSINSNKASGFGIVEINASLNSSKPTDEAQEVLEGLELKIRSNLYWVSKLIIMYSGYSFTTKPFRAALIQALKTEPERTDE